MTTCNFQGTSLVLSKLVRIQSKQDSQGCKEIKGHMLGLQLLNIRPKNIGLEKQQL